MKSSTIDLRIWRQFSVLAQELHFGRAAARLNMTQPPLTQAIAKLEASLGVMLFDRTRRRVALTPTAVALLPEVDWLLARALDLPQQARAAADGSAGRLRLAFVSTVGYTLLPQWARAFREAHPGVQLELLEATGDVQLDAFARAQVDAGFMLHAQGFAPGGLVRLSVATEPLVLALPEQHALARSARAPALSAILQQPLVLFPRRIAPSLFDLIAGQYQAAGVTMQVAQEAIQMQTIVNLVSAGLGVAWVPHSVTQFQRSGVVYRPVPARAGAGARLCETSLVWDASHVNPVLHRFVAFARERAQSNAC